MIHYSACPACDSTEISFSFRCRDHSVSGQEFDIWACKGCSIRFTQDVPEQENIAPYYQSEAYISHTDSQKGLINRIYHIVRNRTMQRKVQLLKDVSGKSAGRLLDIGAGTGMFCKTMQQAGWMVTGIEPDAQTRKWANAHRQIELLDADSFFLLKQPQDVITMWHVLEHVHLLHPYMAQMAKLLEDTGKLIIAVPNYTSFDATHYGKDWAAYDVPRHLYHFSPAAMEKLLSRHGFRLASCKPMWFDSFYVSMLTEKYKRSSAGIFRALITGARSNIKAISDNRKCSSVIYIAEKSKIS